jgi:hypothetical protein
MSLDDTPAVEPVVPQRCAVCGAQLIPSEQQAVLESGSLPLCSLHAAEVVPLEDEAADR